MSKEFYYLEKKEQKGPLSIDHLKAVGLTADTLVWTDGFENWKPVKDVEELKELLKKMPPPPPIIDNSPNSTTQPSQESQDDKKVLIEDSNVKFWVVCKIYGIVFLLVGLSIFTACSISSNKKQKLKKEIYTKVDNILDGKTVVLDGVYSLTQGELKETDYLKETEYKKENPFDGAFAWWNLEKLHTVYEATYGGFTIKQLTRQNGDGFDIETYRSGDMGYKKPLGKYVESEYVDIGRGEKMKISGGYYANNYRLPVRECYIKAFEYFTKEDKKSQGAYTPGKYVDISNFSGIRNEYFYMDNTRQKEYSSLASSWESLGDHEANINTEDWSVYYKTYGKHYEITENETTVRKDLFIYLAITVGSTILLLLTLLFAKPKYFRNLNLFGKQWKNTLYQEQMFFFEHSFFGKHTFVEIFNDKASKGVLKFTGKGNAINLSYPDKEFYYIIEKISQDDLVLITTKDKRSIAFKRVGAKDVEEAKREEVTTEIDEINKKEELGNKETDL